MKKKKRNPPQFTICISLNAETIKRLNILMEKLELNASALVRQAIRELYDREIGDE